MKDLLGPYAYHKIIIDSDNKPMDSEFLEVNPAFELMLGLTKEDIIGKRLLEINPDFLNDDVNWLEFFAKASLDGKPEVIEYHVKSDNIWFLVQINSTKKEYFSTYFTEVTALKQKEAVLTQNNKWLVKAWEQTVASEKNLKKQLEKIGDSQDLNLTRYRSVVENANDVIYSCNLNGLITYANKSFCEIAGKPAQEIVGKNIAQFLQFENTEMTWNNFLFKGVIATTGQTEYEFKLSDGTFRHYQITLAPIFDIHKKIIEVIGTNRDVTAIKQNEQKIMVLAYRDSLTDLPNKNLFLDRLNTSIVTCRRAGTKAAVILVDLDNFKKYINTLGYLVGEKIIVEAAQKLVSCMRDYDTVARVGEDDDRFLLLFQNIRHNNELFPIIKRIKESLNEPYSIDGNQMKITASIGIAVFPDDGDNSEDILINVDKAMYMAKELGKNRYHFFNDSLKEELERKTKLETMLNNAIANHEFELYYQPQYEARSRRLRGFEALIRWNNPEVGLVMPMEFVPFAEETGLIIPIGIWVLNTACKLCNKVNKEFGLNLSMSINISPVQIKQKNFYEIVVKTIQDSGLEMSNLELEITEGAFIKQDQGNNVLRMLKDKGVRITLADFGTGNFSISDLKKLPVNMVKLDKEFIHEIDQSSYQDALAESIISLMHKLDIELIASGVENIKQYDYLLRGECDNIQGFFFEEPVSEDMIEEVIKRGVLENDALNRVIQKAGLTYEGFVRREIVRIGKRWDTKL